ncbi:hypothetical protein [Streptomyces sp. WMMC897]|uniref:hypothetical protein n=1 Tax=Streptomyces sp. WMMC897 TaxID=3014782 RepID=UPI0022B6C147|nr:hypothetical protein [Streptomyces sp. WMMC897]MCZ7417802.1 hypothetical protein [Streptomyces sp. WMMC897]
MSDPERRTNRRAVVIILALALVCASIGGVLLWATRDEAAPEPHACQGYLTDEAISFLAGGKEVDDDPSWTQYVDDSGAFESHAAEVLGDLSRCGVILPNGDIAEFTTSTVWDVGPYQSAPLDASWYGHAAPLGSALGGWTERGRGAVLLPDACTKKFPSQGKPVQVTLKLRHAYIGDVPAPSRPELAGALVSYASTMAELKGCGTKGFRLSGVVPEAASPESLPDRDGCGLPGFVATRPQSAGPALDQAVVGSAGDSWSCVVGRELDGEEPQAAAAFVLTTHQQIIERYDRATHRDNENTRAELVTCAGKEYLAILVFGAEDAEDPPPHMEQGQKLAETRLKPKEELYQDFLAAAKISLGCSAAPGR